MTPVGIKFIRFRLSGQGKGNTWIENIDSSNILNYNDLENTWGHGAAGSAPRSQRGGPGFESP